MFCTKLSDCPSYGCESLTESHLLGKVRNGATKDETRTRAILRVHHRGKEQHWGVEGSRLRMTNNAARGRSGNPNI